MNRQLGARSGDRRLHDHDLAAVGERATGNACDGRKDAAEHDGRERGPESNEAGRGARPRGCALVAAQQVLVPSFVIRSSGYVAGSKLGPNSAM